MTHQVTGTLKNPEIEVHPFDIGLEQERESTAAANYCASSSDPRMIPDSELMWAERGSRLKQPINCRMLRALRRGFGRRRSTGKRL